MAFCLAALDGTIPKLNQPTYCNSLFKTEAANLDARGARPLGRDCRGEVE